MRKTIASLVLAAAVLEGKIAGSSAATGELSNLGATNFDQSYRFVSSRMLRGKKQIDDKEELDGEADDEERGRGRIVPDLGNTEAVMSRINDHLQHAQIHEIQEKERLLSVFERLRVTVPEVKELAKYGRVVAGMEITEELANAYEVRINVRYGDEAETS
ncbi:hypothetical protein PsorP6_007995 [Peronosclerospora sorghi]|uniref:Uncharacterized protein n=1 Tax=Peronosclerospora sorghi TaxID=230839 RepID=A0ACC0WD73_9STRA|nr:hypothetical protein PsorP6_007995 [Peronosclerospora sorghi]